MAVFNWKKVNSHSRMRQHGDVALDINAWLSNLYYTCWLTDWLGRLRNDVIRDDVNVNDFPGDDAEENQDKAAQHRVWRLRDLWLHRPRPRRNVELEINQL